jgi:hypothetical protein
MAPPAREPELDLDQRWERPLIGNVVSRIYHTPEQHNYGDVRPQNQVRFWTEREAIEAGYRRAMNDHYGPGSGVAQEPGARRRGTREGGLHTAGPWDRNRGHAVADSMQAGVHIQLEEEYDRGYTR